MSNLPYGYFCWGEIATKDTAGAKKFYGELFGWTFAEADMPDGGQYSMISLGQHHVGGLFALHGQASEMPPHWTHYLLVEDLQAKVDLGVSLGAKVIAPPFEVMTAGSMAILQDPTGAMIWFWQPKEHVGYGAFEFGAAGAPSWRELMTTNIDQALEFYQKLMGWQVQSYPMGDFHYHTLGPDPQRPACGMMQQPPGQEGAPSSWLVYYNVTDVDQSTAQAQKLGAAVLHGPMDVPGVCRMTVLADPQGAVFAIVKFLPMPMD